MLQHRLSRNMHITLRSREYVIEKRLPDRTIRIKDVLTDERIAIPEQELIEALFEKGAQLLGHNRNQDALKERLERLGFAILEYSKKMIQGRFNCNGDSHTLGQFLRHG